MVSLQVLPELTLVFTPVSEILDKELAMETELQAEIRAWQNARERMEQHILKFNKLSSWSDSNIGRRITDIHFVNVTAAMRDLLEGDSRGGAKKYRGPITHLRDTGLSAGVIAYIVTKTILNELTLGIHKSTGKFGLNRNTICLNIADAVHEEWKYSVVFTKDSERRSNLFKRLQADFQKEAYPVSWRRRILSAAFNREVMNWSGWTKPTRASIGRLLFDAFLQVPFIFKEYQTSVVETISTPGRGVLVSPSEGFETLVFAYMECNIQEFMIYPPMLVKPRKWTPGTLFSGGYIYQYKDTKKDVLGNTVLDENGEAVFIKKDYVKPYPGVKRQARDVPTNDYVYNRDWSMVLPSVNALQETPFIINRKVYDVMSWAFDEGMEIEGIPLGRNKPLPNFSGNFKTASKEEKDAHNRERFKIRKENVQTKTKRIMFMGAMLTAKAYLSAEAIYFPHDMDHRGRAYCKPSYLSLQGQSYVKSLLLFKEGRPLATENGVRWLAIHGANSYGKDKLSLDDRVKFIRDNEEMILSCAVDPIADRRWTQADNPFEFLAFAFEWLGYKNEGLSFVSHIPVAVDATCSGLQHYGAMLRCPETARAVNLTNEGKRRDIYQDVADRTSELLKQETEYEFVNLAEAFLKFGIDRKVTKRATMTLPYSATFKSCMDYVRDAIMERVKAGEMAPWADFPEYLNAPPEKGGQEALEMKYCSYLAKKVWQAIGETVVRAREAMDWLAHAARTMSNHQNKTHPDSVLYQKALRWTTPDGFVVNHSEPQQQEKWVKTTLMGETKIRGRRLKQTEIWFVEDTDNLDPADMASAVAPNFVHSLDATLLRMTISKALLINIGSFMMIHDSFAVHAADMEVFIEECIKKAFIEMYTQHDVMADLRASFPEDLELPPLPNKGTLDLNAVQQSEFFFS